MGRNANEVFDVFLCHNSADKPAVRKLAKRLKEHGLNPWLDEEQLQPGLPWQRALESILVRVNSAAVFVGANGFGPWQEMEQDALLRQFVERQCPVIPVLLRDAPAKPELPLFLRGFLWVDLRKSDPDPFDQLVFGVTGKRPGKRSDAMQAPPPVDLDVAESFHIEWPFEKELRRLLEAGGATVTLRGHAKIGKTSLLMRLHRWGLEGENRISCYLNFHGFGKAQFGDTHKLLRAIADEMSNELDGQFDYFVNVEEQWKPQRTAQQNLTRFVEAVIDGVPRKELQLFLDDADLAFDYNQSATDLFGLLRSWHEKRKIDVKGRWKRVNLVVAHATDPAIWIEDLNQSPFNVGDRFRLEDFDEPQVEELNVKYGEPVAQAELFKLMKLVGGHPYLLRLAFYWLANHKGSLKKLDAVAADVEGPFADVLSHLFNMVLNQKNKRMRVALKAVLDRGICDSGQREEDESLFQKLCSAGLLAGPTRNQARFRNDVYRRFFELRLQ